MITIKTNEEIKILRAGGQILARILDQVAKAVKPGVNTADLEALACRLIEQAGGRPSFKGYASGAKGEKFPTALCTSINEEIVHAPALPGRVVRSGDILSIDVGMEYPFSAQTFKLFPEYKKGRGLFTDMAITVPVGKVSKQAKKLIKVTEQALKLGIKQVRAGNTLAQIGQAIENYARKYDFGVVRDLVGHGVGYAVHEEPIVPNYPTAAAKTIILKQGMVIAIEPMITLGSWRITTVNDNPFTFKTADGSLSAHFEHTVAVGHKGPIVITER